MKVTARMQGLREFEAAMSELTKATARNVLNRALKAAAQPALETARRLVRRDTGLTLELLSVKQNTAKQRGSRAAAVSVGVTDKRRRSFIHLLEFGTARSSPRPFIRPAADSTRGSTIAIFRSQLKVEIDKAVERARKKAARLKAKGG